MQEMLRKGILIPMLMALFLTSAYAQECFAPSPTIRTGAKYPPIKVRKLTRSEFDNIRNLLESLVGELSGSGEELSCRGNASDPLQQTIRYTINAKATLDHFGHFRMELDLYALEEKVTHSENQDLYLTENNLQVDSSNSAGDVELIAISADTIKYRQKRSIAGSYPYGGPTNGEEFTTIRQINNGFVFIQSYYFQGHFIGKKEWRLSK